MRVVLPGYETSVTGNDSGQQVYVSSAEDIAGIIEALEKGETPQVDKSKTASSVEASSFKVEVQNGTDVAGAASTTADTLKAKGFNITKTGNAEQQVYKETLVVYKSEDAQGANRAKTVIDALGLGRAVEGGDYYTFDDDILLIIGYDYKPVT